MHKDSINNVTQNLASAIKDGLTFNTRNCEVEQKVKSPYKSTLSKHKERSSQLNNLPWYPSLLEFHHQGTQIQNYKMTTPLNTTAIINNIYKKNQHIRLIQTPMQSHGNSIV